MRNIIQIAAVAALLAAGSSAAIAKDNSAKGTPPGHDRVCLVTTGNPGRFWDVDVIDTKWLPRKAAEAQASKDPSTLKVFDYSTDELVVGPNKKYASAEELCNEHFG